MSLIKIRFPGPPLTSRKSLMSTNGDRSNDPADLQVPIVEIKCIDRYTEFETYIVTRTV